MPDTGAKPPEPGRIGDALVSIEAAVDGGSTDLSGLGFWRIVRTVKAHPALLERHADTIGRIDHKAFEARVWPRFPVWLGNGSLLVGTLAGAGAVAYAISCDVPTVSAALLVGGGAIWSVTLHDLAHWVVGRIQGIRFACYFLDGPFRIQPGLKTDYATYLKAQPGERATMHAAGALASKAAPFVALAFWPVADASPWAAWALAGVGVLQIFTDVIWSTRKSDWKKVRRERRLAAAQRAARM